MSSLVSLTWLLVWYFVAHGLSQCLKARSKQLNLLWDKHTDRLTVTCVFPLTFNPLGQQQLWCTINHLSKSVHIHSNVNTFVYAFLSSCLCLTGDKNGILCPFILIALFLFSWLLTDTEHTPPHLPFCIFPPCSWLAANLTWRWTSSSRNRRASCAWWSCWTSVSPPVRLRSGASSLRSSRRASATCRRALMLGSSSRWSSVYPPLTAWSQVLSTAASWKSC